MEFLKNEKSDWIEISKLKSLFQESKVSEDRFSIFSKKIWLYKVDKSDLPWFNDFENTKDCLSLYLHFKTLLAGPFSSYLASYNIDKELLAQVNDFDGNWLDDFEAKIGYLLSCWLSDRARLLEARDEFSKFENEVEDTPETAIIIDRFKKEYDTTWILGMINADNEGKIMKLYEEKKKKVNPDWKRKSGDWYVFPPELDKKIDEKLKTMLESDEYKISDETRKVIERESVRIKNNKK